MPELAEVDQPRKAPPPRSLDDLMNLVGVNRDTARRWCKHGDIAAVRIGRKWFVPDHEFERIRTALAPRDPRDEAA